jgi:hypothetical protein
MADDDHRGAADSRESDGMAIIFAVIALIVVTCAGAFFIGDWRERHPVTASTPGQTIQAWAR